MTYGMSVNLSLCGHRLHTAPSNSTSLREHYEGLGCKVIREGPKPECPSPGVKLQRPHADGQRGQAAVPDVVSLVHRHGAQIAEPLQAEVLAG